MSLRRGRLHVRRLRGGRLGGWKPCRLGLDSRLKWPSRSSPYHVENESIKHNKLNKNKNKKQITQLRKTKY